MAVDAMLQFPAENFELISAGGLPFTIPVKGQKMVLPTESVDVLPSHNKFTGNADRCTIEETPWGGMKGNYVPDFSPGTVAVNPASGAGVYVQSTAGTNTGTYLTAGKLSELGKLTIDRTAKTITEELQVINTEQSSASSQILADGTNTIGWSMSTGILTSLSSDNGRIKIVGRSDTANGLKITKSGLNVTGKDFISFDIECSANKNLYLYVSSPGIYKYWRGSRFPIQAGIPTRFVLPLNAPQLAAGINPTVSTGDLNLSNLTIAIGTDQLDVSDITIYIDNIRADVGKKAVVEIDVPNDLGTQSLTLQCYTGVGDSGYETHRVCSLNSEYSTVSVDSAKLKFLDGTAYDSAFPSGAGRSVFVKGIAGQQNVSGLVGTINYSANAGSKYRIAIQFYLPPSDNNRTNCSKMRLRLITSYTGSGETTYIFTKDTNQSTGFNNLTNPWIVMLDSSGDVGYLVFTDRPNSISYIRDDSGNIKEFVIDPGNSMVYRGQTYLGDHSTDTNSDGIPDCLEESIESSVANVLKFNKFNS